MASLSAPCFHVEPPEEDPLVYTEGDEDNNNLPQYILDIALNGGSGWGEIYTKSKQEETPEKHG